MARAHYTLAYVCLLSTLYLLLLYSVLPLPFVSKQASDEILPVIPWWLLVAFGSYSLSSLGWGLCTFRDCPESYEELMKEIGEAKNDLRSRGVQVD